MSNWTGQTPGSACVLGPSIRITGSLAATQDLVLQGRFSGEIDMPQAALTLGATADIEATIFARDLTIEGRFRGRITATEIVEIRATATVSATVTAPSLIVEDGAVVHGDIEMKRADAAARVARYRMEKREQRSSA